MSLFLPDIVSFAGSHRIGIDNISGSSFRQNFRSHKVIFPLKLTIEKTNLNAIDQFGLSCGHQHDEQQSAHVHPHTDPRPPWRSMTRVPKVVEQGRTTNTKESHEKNNLAKEFGEMGAKVERDGGGGGVMRGG